MTATEAVRMGTNDFQFYFQTCPEGCGVAAVRSVLASQFKQKKSDREILRRIYGFYQKNSTNNPKRLFIKKGTSPGAMAYCFRKTINPHARIFCSKQGSVKILNYILEHFHVVPVIHQMVSERGKKREGHYMVFAGAKKNKVMIFDPEPGEGWKEFSIKEFQKRWKNKDERWFLITLPPEVNIDCLSGKYI